MKTTELYIEQVLIGFLVIAIATLPWAPELGPELVGISGVKAIAEGSLLLGLAFWLGIPFDRFADTLSERLDRHNRLQFALYRAAGEKLPKPQEKRPDRLDRDIYPEDKLRQNALASAEGLVNWIEYHRSRIRLARALAVYGPALTVSVTVGMSRLKWPTPPVGVVWPYGVLVAGYWLWAIVASPPKALRKNHAKESSDNWVFGERLPRTDAAEFLCYGKKQSLVEDGRFVQPRTSHLRIWGSEFRVLLVPVGLILAALVLAIRDGQKTATAASAATLITIISAWSWWRISFTYRSYLYAFRGKSESTNDSATDKAQ